jgi:hypothetical protein
MAAVGSVVDFEMAHPSRTRGDVPVGKESACDLPTAEPSRPRKRNCTRPVFSQADVTRAVRGVIRAGAGPIWRVRIEPTGAILVELGKPVAPTDGNDDVEQWLSKHHAHQR